MRLRLRTKLVEFLRSGYRYGISPVIHFLNGPGAGCRFVPSCSEFATEAVIRHGWISGTWIGFKRVCRCHPFSGHEGFDPVPQKR